MLFDWFTFFAQLVNFLILVWLLKRYLFKPILSAIDEREKLIASHLHEAEISKSAAKKEYDDFNKKNKEFDIQRNELLTNAINEINTERQKLLEQARNEVESIRLRLEESLRNEQKRLGYEIIRRARSEVFAVVRKTLDDLASVSLEDQMAIVFIRRINELNPDEKISVDSALIHSSGQIVVRSMFDLPSDRQDEIQKAIKDNLNQVREIKFETAPELVSGIELIANGYRVSWTIEEYLISLEAHISELLNAKTEIKPEVITS